MRPFIGRWIRFSSIFPHLCRLIQHYQGTLFTFCQSDCRLAYKNNEFHGFRYLPKLIYILTSTHSFYNKNISLHLCKALDTVMSPPSFDNHKNQQQIRPCPAMLQIHGRLPVSIDIWLIHSPAYYMLHYTLYYTLFASSYTILR